MIALLIAAAAFNPITFFLGRTQGEGTVKVILQKPQRISVDSFGRVARDGSLILDQTIRGRGKPPRTRSWRFRQTAPNRFEGTLTDAAGPVRLDVHGQRLRIRYKDRDNLDIEQWLTPAGPRQVNNAMRVKRFRITVARVEEVIRKRD